MMEAQEQPKPIQVHVLTQFVKDLSFESPNPPTNHEQQPQLSVNFNVNGRHLENDDHEVSIRFEGALKVGDTNTIFQFDLTYCGILRLENVTAENVQAVVMVTGPSLLFPFARQVVAQTIASGGYPPLLLQPIDFGALLRQTQSPTSVSEPVPARNPTLDQEPPTPTLQ